MTVETQTRQLPSMQLRGVVQPSTLDRAKRTVEITWTTGARVLRGWFEQYYEELSLDPRHVHLDRLNNGAPFLADHNGYRVVETPGVVERAWLTTSEGQQVGRALIRFIKEGIDPDADMLFNKIADGVVANVSVGYRVHRLEKVADADDKVPVMRATSWTPFEVSAVAMGADDGAGFRSARTADTNPCEVITRGASPQKANKMDPENQTPAESANADQIRAAERERITTITILVQRSGLPQEFGRKLVDDGTSLDKARVAILDELAKRSDAVPTFGVQRVEAGTVGGHDDFRSAAIDALVQRAGVRVDKPHPAAIDLQRSSVLEIARTCLSRAGKRSSMLSNGELIKRAFSTSDFPEILAGSIGKALRQGYEIEPASHRLWVRVESVPDFRDQLRPLLGSAPGLAEIREMGEYTYAAVSEDAATYKVAKYGKAIALSWELLINDNLGAFLRVKPAMGQAARRKEADLVYSMFAENSGAGPTMQDSLPLFHATHKNIADTDNGITAGGLGSARTLLRKQTALGGGYLSLVPRFVIVSPELETETEILLAAATRTISTTTEGDRPEWIGRLTPVVEPRLSGAAYYLATSSEQIDTAVLGLLEENMGGPVVEEDSEFNRDATRYKVRHVAGAKFLDWRGIVKVPTT